jgi:hypothetical protein
MNPEFGPVTQFREITHLRTSSVRSIMESTPVSHAKAFQGEAKVTEEQESQLERLEAEIQIAERALRLVQIKKQIAETELDIVGLQQTLRQQRENPIHVS